ncbi:Na+-transporting NADH:ubiquinone oxidoreductase subunit A [Flavobacterium flevense]|uniref:Na(+)-translocating NADH-quinone reductase subunit A n=1 Tax=Flavobacterium flevense TaxID=983 RepID=A0A4Y4AQV2_9FLAO|nr:Na(+)-translocating NADH-quinone reductase subunit A [Flavobacterium flevense]GEC70581.1 Na(+)-translocating NADH-quinone reductase subunit A [Flavobacterium flevense]SHL64014.1 Na+-transporting NADH:ubiquinone oxidoreductase subunit A [Flavobacterium flevense]
MSEYIKIKQGLDLKLSGEAAKSVIALPVAEIFAIKPKDFVGLTPKLLVKAGANVAAGTPVFFDKNDESILFCSPVSGEIIEIVRGEKRVILEIKILADREIKYVSSTPSNPDQLSRNEIIEKLLKSGCWPFIRQRPYGTIANPKDKPKAIFISAFDTNPLAPDYDFILSAEETNFQIGINALKKLTTGKIHLNIKANSTSAPVFTQAQNVQINTISGPHPAGNVGVQIHHIDPINKGEVVWHINPQDVIIIGKLFNQGIFDASRTVAVTGAQLEKPQYYKTIVGTNIKNILADAVLKKGDNRIISGSVLSGSQIPVDGFLGFYDAQITVILEGNEYEFMGWLAPGFNKFSVSRTFFSWLSPNKKYNLNTNLHGEERPFVMTGQYEKVFPMDIYPVQLLKSILIEDIELMEKLGIYEVAEEDFALCELICTSKIKSQEIIRHGLDMVRKEFS